jgi:hypothetical protein
MDIDHLLTRLHTNLKGLSEITGIARSTINSWRVDRAKPYAASYSPASLRRMAANLRLYADAVQVLAVELDREADGMPKRKPRGRTRNDEAHLLRSPANAARLLAALEVAHKRTEDRCS